MKFIVVILLSLTLVACQTLGATGIKQVTSEKKQTVYEVHVQTGHGYSYLTGHVYSGSEKFKAYKKLPVGQQTITDSRFRKRELAELARKKCSGGFKVVQQFPIQRLRINSSIFHTSKFQFICT